MLNPPGNILLKLMVTCSVAMVMGMGQLPARETPCQDQRDVRAGALDETTWKRLNAVYQQISEGRLDSAFDDLQKLLGQADRDPYLQAIIYQALARVEWSRELPGAALDYTESALELDALPDPVHFELMFQAARLHFALQHYQQTLHWLDAWFCAAPPDSDSREDGFRLMLAAQYELEQYHQAAGTLEALVEEWPGRKIYWVQLAQVYYRLNLPQRSLAVMALAYRNGLLDQQADILFLSGLFSEMEIPYRAAEVLEKGIRDGIVEPGRQHWIRAAETWYAANEMAKSLAAFEQAGMHSADGRADLRRGYILVDLERWAAARDALSQALNKGGLDGRETAEGYLLRGISRFNLGDLEAAEADWGMAEQYRETQEAARQWISHLREERRRRTS